MPLASEQSMKPSMGGGVMIEQDVDHGMTNTPMPGSLGAGQGQLATAMMGMVSDQRAAVQQTARAMSEIAVLAQRLNVMLGGTTGSGSSVEPSISVGSASAAVAAVAGNSYGTGVNNRPMIIPSASPGYGVGGSAFGAMPVNPGSGPQYTQYSGFGTQETTSSVVLPPTGQPAGATPETGGWTPPTAPERSGAGHGERDTLAAGAVLEKSFHQGKSIQGIAQALQARAAVNGWGGGAIGSRLFGETGVVADLASGTSVGSTALGALGAGGEVGLAAGAVYGAYRGADAFLTDERQKNAAYQSILGGSNLGGLQQRGLAALFGLGQFGVFSPGESDHIFQAVTALGQTGSARQKGLDFVTGNYRSMGMDPNQSIDLLTTSVQNAAGDLDSLTASLQNVTAAARSASVNADTFRQSFIQTYGQMVSAYGGAGGASASVAGAITATTASEGWLGQGGGTDLSSLSSQAMSAAALGTTIGRVEAGGPTRALKGHEAIYNQWGKASFESQLQGGTGSARFQQLLRQSRDAAGTYQPTHALQAYLESHGISQANLPGMLESVGLSGKGSLPQLQTRYINYLTGAGNKATERNLTQNAATQRINSAHDAWVAANPNRMDAIFGLHAGGGWGNDVIRASDIGGNFAGAAVYHAYDAIAHTGHDIADQSGLHALGQRSYNFGQHTQHFIQDTWDSIFGGGGHQDGTAVLGNASQQWAKNHPSQYAAIMAGHPDHVSQARPSTRSNSGRQAGRPNQGTNRPQTGTQNVHVTVGFDQHAKTLLKVVAQNTDTDALQHPGNPQTPFPQIANG